MRQKARFSARRVRLVGASTEKCWPDPKGMVAELKQMGVELMISPYFYSVTAQSKNYPLALSEGLLVLDPVTKTPAKGAYGNAIIYDLFNPKARDYAWAAVEAGYIKPYGLHHWWLDCDEPCGHSKSMGSLL